MLDQAPDELFGALQTPALLWVTFSFASIASKLNNVQGSYRQEFQRAAQALQNNKALRSLTNTCDVLPG